MRSTLLLFFAATISLVISSCGKDIEESNEQAHRRYIEAFIENNYPGVKPTESGLYILDSIPGTGAKVSDSSYVLIDYTITYLDGYYIDYTSADIARQLGQFSYQKLYEPRIWSMTDQESGIKEIFSYMREGGEITAIIPPWLMGEDTENLTGNSDGTAKIYNISLKKVIKDVIAYQDSLLNDYVKERWSYLDTTEAGFYFLKTKYNPDPTDTLLDEQSVKLRYIGRYLNGQVFDTNIADTAKKYGIYSQCSYELLSFKYFDNEDDALNQNSLVTGFSKALWRMTFDERCRTFFNSNFGYGNSGSGNIPGYTPLCFEIQVEKNPEKEDE